MKNFKLIFPFVKVLWWFLCSCHKESGEMVSPTVIQPLPVKEIFNSSLEWRYNQDKKVLNAWVTRLQDPPGPNSADSIEAVYQFWNGNYLEVPRGNAGNSDSIYYEIESKSIVLYKKYYRSGEWFAGFMATMNAIAAATGEISKTNLPKKAKVEFR